VKLIFIGSSEYGIPALEELVSHKEHQILLVISQPSRPKGRKQILEATPLALAAAQLGFEVFTPEDINSEASLTRIKALQPDLIITASYGAFLGRELRKTALCLNLHPSLLPQYRGSSPIRTAILNGDTISGNTIFRLIARMDAGPILVQESLSIDEGECYSSLHDRLANHAAMLLMQYLMTPESFPEQPQDESLATYTEMFGKTDTLLHWHNPCNLILNKIRAYAEEPGAYTMFRDKELKILYAQMDSPGSTHEPGTICKIIKNQGFTIAAGDGEILISKVQAAGKRAMDAWAFHLGARLNPGEKVG